HTCHAYQNIQAEFKLSVTESNQLISCDRYQTLPAAVATDMDVVPVCCNKSLSFYFSKSTPIANCPSCHARTVALPSINANVRVARVTRYLGRDKGVIDHESVGPEEKCLKILKELFQDLALDDPWREQRRPLCYY